MPTDINIIKKISLYSAIFCLFFSFLALIPALMPIISLFILPFLSAVIILIAIKIIDPMQETDIKEYAVLGSMIGGISGFSFLIVFTPLVLLIHLIFKDYYAYGINYLNFFIAMVFIITISIIFLITNAGGGLLAGFLIKQFDKLKNNKKEQK